MCALVRVSVNLNLCEHASRCLCRHTRRWNGWTRPDALPHRRSPTRVLPAHLLEAAALFGRALLLTHVCSDCAQPRALLAGDTGEFPIRLPSAAG